MAHVSGNVPEMPSIKSLGYMAVSALAVTIFSLVVLEVLRRRGIDPVSYISGMIPTTAPRMSAMDVAPMAPAADAAMVA